MTSLEREPQRELNQPRGAECGNDAAEGTARFHVRYRGIRKVGMVPDVEEVCRETQTVAFGQLEILLERKVPVLLERATKGITAQISKQGYAGVSGRVRADARGEI